MRAKLSTSQIYTNGALLFAGYNTAAQFAAALGAEEEKQTHQGVSNRAHTTTPNTVRHCSVFFYLFYFQYCLCFLITQTSLEQPGQI